MSIENYRFPLLERVSLHLFFDAVNEWGADDVHARKSEVPYECWEERGGVESISTDLQDK